MQKKNRVYGIIGLRSNMSNWNADFSGRPKTLSNGSIYGSDKAFKYPVKVKWDFNGEKVLYIKSLQVKNGTVVARSLAERYEYIFGEKIIKKSKGKKINKDNEDSAENIKVLSNIFKCIDVINFGATFAEEGCNFSITGAVQIGQGFNLYNDSRIEVQDILSPFINSSNNNIKKDTDDEKKNTSIGTKITSDEAHYCYPFTVNPSNYKNYEEIIDGFEGYTVEAYEKFKEAAKTSVTEFATNSKFGCDNEYAIFIELKENSNKALPMLSYYVDFEKIGNDCVLDISKLMDFLLEIDDIDSIEINFNPEFIKIKNKSEFKRYISKHILTGKEVQI